MKILAFALALFICTGSIAAPPLDSVPGSGSLAFGIWRGGTRIGTHSFAFRRAGEDLIVEQHIDVVVQAAFVTLYRYSTKRLEVLHEGRLTQFDSETDDDGKRSQVRARAAEGGVTVEGSSGIHRLGGDAMAFGLWNPAAVQGVPVFDAEDGRPMKITVQATEGDMVSRYRVTGDVNYVISYTGAVLRDVKIVARDGSTIEYMRE
jgi:hypothetical protein